MRTGRAESAPLLRKREGLPTHLEEDKEAEDLGVELLKGHEEIYDDMEAHDPSVLPHMYDNNAMDELFPVIVPADEEVSYEDYIGTGPNYTTTSTTTSSATTSAHSATSASPHGAGAPAGWGN